MTDSIGTLSRWCRRPKDVVTCRVMLWVVSCRGCLIFLFLLLLSLRIQGSFKQDKNVKNRDRVMIKTLESDTTGGGLY